MTGFLNGRTAARWPKPGQCAPKNKFSNRPLRCSEGIMHQSSLEIEVVKPRQINRLAAVARILERRVAATEEAARVVRSTWQELDAALKRARALSGDPIVVRAVPGEPGRGVSGVGPEPRRLLRAQRGPDDAGALPAALCLQRGPLGCPRCDARRSGAQAMSARHKTDRYCLRCRKPMKRKQRIEMGWSVMTGRIAVCSPECRDKWNENR